MPELTPTVIDNVAKICQVLSFRDISTQNVFKGGALDERLPIMIYNERVALEWAMAANPSDPTLQNMANYVYALCYPYVPKAQQIISNLSGSLPVITGPGNQSGIAGFTATFSVSVVSATNVAYQWYKNGILIPGAVSSSLVVPNAQVVDSGSTFFVTATNATGTQVSGTAVLTVTQSIIGQWYAGGTDYSTQLAAGTDAVPYSGTFSITDGQPFNVPFPIGQSDFVVIKYPVSQALRVHYENPAAGIDQAAIPGLAFDQNTFGGNNYTFSRNGNPFGINNTTGIVKFS